MTTLQGIRSDTAWESFYTLVESLQQKFDVNEAVLPHNRKVPRRYEEGQATGFHSKTAADLYRVAYFEALDLAVYAINERFDQPGYAMYPNLEELLLKAIRGDDYADELRQVINLYQELDCSVLRNS